MRKLAFFMASAWLLALMLVIATPHTALALKPGIWTGRVEHVSTQNIKVYNPTAKQSLSFLLVPKFSSVFSDDGKTTIQMSTIKPGMWVKVYYDQKALGARHADKIVMMKNGEAMKS